MDLYLVLAHYFGILDLPHESLLLAVEFLVILVDECAFGLLQVGEIELTVPE